MRGARVLVVGAGLAGLAAAHRLRRAGCAVALLEARPCVGGKYAEVKLAGASVEGWPALTPRSSPALVELAAETGVASQLARAPIDRVGWLSRERVRAASPRLRDFMRLSPLTPTRLRRLALLESWLGSELDPTEPERTTRLDDRSVADFSRVYLGGRVLERLLAPLFATHFGVAAEDASRQLLFSLLDGRAGLGVDRVGAIAPLVERLVGNAAELRLGARVESLESDGRGVRLAGGERLAADAVVLAVGAREALRLLPDPSPAQVSAGESLREASALVLTLSLRPGLALPARTLLVPASEGGELAGVIDESPRETAHHLLRLIARPGLFERHGHRPDAELAHFLIESATRALPGLAGLVEAQMLQRLPRALPAFDVGHFRAVARIRAGVGARTERNLALAGDWLIGPHVEGALASGLRGAAELGAQA